MRKSTLLKYASGKIGLAVLVAGLLVFGGMYTQKQQVIKATSPSGETKRVIVTFKNAQAVGADDSLAEINQKRASIKQSESEIINSTGGYVEKTRSYNNLPVAAFTVDANGEQALKNNPNVEKVSEDRFYKPTLDQAIPTIGGNVTTGFSDGTTNYNGNNKVIAILDTGVDGTHSMLSGKVINEHCFGVNGTGPGYVVDSFCAGAGTDVGGAGSGAPCSITPTCDHGTAVAGIAAGSTQTFGSGPSHTIAGSANGAEIIAVQVFVEVTGVSVCGSPSPCAMTLDSVYLAGMNYVLNLAINNTLNKQIAAVNMSLGGAPFYTDQVSCNADTYITPVNTAMASLKTQGIATVVATGNDGDDPLNVDKIASPACAQNAIAVSATNMSGTAISSYANNGQLTDLLAPGGDYDGVNPNSMMLVAEPGDLASYGQGTSYATPLVAGAFAVLREKHPDASVDSLLNLLKNTGTGVAENRVGYAANTKPLIQLDTALANSPYPSIASFTGPSGTVNQGSNITLNATVSNASECSLNNGVGAVTISGGSISKSVPAAASYTLTCKNLYEDDVQQTLNFTYNTGPTTPGALMGVANKAAKTFTLTWSQSSDTDGIQAYEVYLNGQLVSTLASSETSYTFENIASGQTYTAEVYAVDSLGARSFAASLQFDGDGILSTNGALGVPNTGSQSENTVMKAFSWTVVALITLVGLYGIYRVLLKSKLFPQGS